MGNYMEWHLEENSYLFCNESKPQHDFHVHSRDAVLMLLQALLSFFNPFGWIVSLHCLIRFRIFSSISFHSLTELQTFFLNQNRKTKATITWIFWKKKREKLKKKKLQTNKNKNKGKQWKCQKMTSLWESTETIYHPIIINHLQ